MRSRPSMYRKTNATLALAALFIVSIASSAGAESLASPQDREKTPVLGEADFTGEMSIAKRGEAKAKLEINSLKRAKNGKLTTLMYTIHNEKDSVEFPLGAWNSSETYNYAPIKSVSGAVIDTDDKIRYHNLTDEKFYCFCSNQNGESTAGVIDPGSTGVMWGSFLVPKDVKSVTVRVPAFGAVEDVPIS